MIVNQLDSVAHPDFNDVVIHFTGRSGPSARSAPIEEMSDWERLCAIVESGQLIGHEMPGTKAHAVCFTEATSAGCAWLVGQGRYTSCGVAFTKRLLFARGGGPVLQVRGDEWSEVGRWPKALRARAVRLWPGAVAETGEDLPWYLTGRSEWMFEREWRVSAGLGFDFDDVAFFVLPTVDHLHQWVRALSPEDARLAKQLARARFVVLSGDGVAAANGVRERRSSASLVSAPEIGARP